MNISKLFRQTLYNRFLSFIPDKLYLRLKYRKKVGRWPNLKKPVTFTEKIQWLKLNYRNPNFCLMVDKFAVKDYVAKIIGSDYIIQTLAVWNKLDDINISTLPDQFVLKWNHDSGSIAICRDKAHFNIEDAKCKLSKGAQTNGFWYGREWPYKGVRPCIIAEKYLEDKSHPGDLPDYKFYCFDGEPRYCQVIRDRQSSETIDFYDMEWNHMPFTGLDPIARNGKIPVARPEHLEKMIDVCQLLANNIPFIRVDMYVVEGKIFFGELTFYPASGFGVFSPPEWDEILGNMLKLPLSK